MNKLAKLNFNKTISILFLLCTLSSLSPLAALEPLPYHTAARVNLGVNSNELNDNSSDGISTNNGRYYFFTSNSINTIYPPADNSYDVYMRDTVLKKTTVVSKTRIQVISAINLY